MQVLLHAARSASGGGLCSAASAAKCGERKRRRLRLDSTTHTLDAAIAPAAASGGRRTRICAERQHERKSIARSEERTAG